MMMLPGASRKTSGAGIAGPSERSDASSTELRNRAIPSPLSDLGFGWHLSSAAPIPAPHLSTPAAASHQRPDTNRSPPALPGCRTTPRARQLPILRLTLIHSESRETAGTYLGAEDVAFRWCHDVGSP